VADDWDSLDHVAYRLPHAELCCTALGVSHKVPTLEQEPWLLSPFLETRSGTASKNACYASVAPSLT
jgi:hypothetical protein